MFPSDAESYHLPAAARRSASPQIDDENAVVNRDALQEWDG